MFRAQRGFVTSSDHRLSTLFSIFLRWMRHGLLHLVLWLASLIGVVSGVLSRLLPARGLNRSDRVVLFSTAARLNPDKTHWIVPLHGWVHQSKRNDTLRRLFFAVISRALGLAVDCREAEFLRERLGWFLVDNLRARTLRLRVGSAEIQVGPTDPQGHFETEVTLPLAALSSVDDYCIVESEVVSDAHAERTFVGRIHAIPATGLSVVSDLDDTVKISQVLDRRALARNTLLRPYRAVPDMATIYRQWAESGMSIHFVSCSPWHLYPAIEDFLFGSGFPLATILCRRLRLKDSSLRAFLSPPDAFKVPRIVELLQQFPERTFVLVGDSGERDPEIYGAIAREHPGRIVGIFIRNVTDASVDDERWAHAFAGVARSRWWLFDDPQVLAEALANCGEASSSETAVAPDQAQ